MPEHLLIATLDMRIYFDHDFHSDGPTLSQHQLTPSSTPGLGVTPDLTSLGEPVFELG